MVFAHWGLSQLSEAIRPQLSDEEEEEEGVVYFVSVPNLLF